MNYKKYWIVLIISALFLFPAVSSMFATATKHSDISGKLQSGYRVLQLPEGKTGIRFTVYRGDYIKFELNSTSEKSLLEIPALKIRKELATDLSISPYFKMKKVGTYPFSIDSVNGTIKVVEYGGRQYQKLTASEAADLIKNISPIILDVRTPQEYSSGHLENSILIPVQELQQRYTELLKFREEHIFVYCATGNRSTVASKILIDHGFTHIHNLRYGVYDWAQKGYPIVR